MKFILLSIIILSFSVVAEPKFSKVGDFELEYEIAGSGEYTVLLEGGAGAGLSDWDPVFYKIAEKATVIRLTRPAGRCDVNPRPGFSAVAGCIM